MNIQTIYFQFKEFYVPFMTPQSIGFKIFAKIMKGSCVFCFSNCISFNPTSHLNIFIAESSSSDIWGGQWHKTFNVKPAFTTLILLLLFQITKMCQCCGFTFANFFFFLMATNALATSWVSFSNTRIIVSEAAIQRCC